MPGPRSCAIAFLLVALAMIAWLCRLLAARMRKPAVAWIAGSYLALLHLISIFGLLTSTRFDSGLAQLDLFTFPFSMLVGDTLLMQGFATLADLAVNYVRFVVCFGGLNALLMAGFAALVLPAGAPRQRAIL